MTSKEQEIKMLEGTPFPLSSFQLTACVGSPGSGKTYQMLRIQKEYEKISKDKYDMMQPDVIAHTPFTHIFYVSGTPCQSLPQKSSDAGKSPYIVKDSAELISVCNYIQNMSKDYNIIKECYELLLNINGTEDVYSLRQIILQLEKYKKKYPELTIQFKSNTLSQLYTILRLSYDNVAIRRPKVALLVDDSSSESYWNSTKDNPIYKFLSKRRHYNVFNCIINIHSITMLFGQFREMVTAYLFFRDVNKDHIKDLWSSTLALERKDFQYDQFLGIYNDHTGYNSPASKQGSMKHNFLYVFKQPEKHVYYDFSEIIF